MICFIQARMSSKRFPKKIIHKIANIEIYRILYQRLLKSKKISKILFLTSNHQSDDKFCEILKNEEIEFYRGDLDNVAQRFLTFAQKLKVKKFIRVCCDSPFISWKMVDDMITNSEKKKFDLFTNSLSKNYVKGNGIEIINTNSLKKNIKNFSKNEKEHVTKYFYDKRNKFKILEFNIKKRFLLKNYCVDYKKDIKILEKYLKKNNPIIFLET